MKRMPTISYREGVSVVGSGTPHWPRHAWSALMTVWSEALPMTASYHSSLPGVWIPADAWENDAIYVRSSGVLISLSATPAYVHPSSNLAEKPTKNENPKSSSQRVLERQRRQGLPTARSHSCSMRCLHYPKPENTRSIKKLRTIMKHLLNDYSSWRKTRTSANDMRMRFSRFNISFINFISVSREYLRSLN